MVTVPRIAQGATVADQTPYQRINAPAEAFGSLQAQSLLQSAEGIGRGADAVGAVALDLQKKKNETSFNEGKVDFDQRVNDLFYAEDGLYSKRGKDALDTAPEISKRIKEIEKEVIERYNPAVQQRLRTSLQEKVNRHSKSMAAFTLKERDVYDQQLSDARKETYASDAARTYNDPDGIRDSAAGAEVIARQDIARLGMSPEAAQRHLVETRTHVYKSAFDAAINNNDVNSARTILEQHGHKMDGVIKNTLEAKLQSAGVLEQAQAETDRIMEMTDVSSQDRLEAARQIEDPHVRKSVEAMVTARNQEATLGLAQGLSDQVMARSELGSQEKLDEIRQHPDPDVRKAALAIAKAQMAEEVAARESALAAYEAQASRFIEEGGTLEQYSIANPEGFASIQGDPDLIKKLEARQDAKAEGRIFSRTTDGETKANYEMMSTEALAKLTDEQLRADRARLTEDEYADVVGMVGAARKKMDATGSDAAMYRRAEEVLREYAPANFGWGEKNPGTNKINSMRQVRHQMYGKLDAIIQSGRIPTDSDFRSIAQGLYLPLEDTRSGWWFGRSDAEFSFQLQNLLPEERDNFAVDLDEVDPPALEEMRQGLKAVGIREPSDSLIQSMFGAEALGDKARQKKLIRDARDKQNGPTPSLNFNPPPGSSGIISAAEAATLPTPVQQATNIAFFFESRGGTLPDRQGSEFVGDFQMGRAMRQDLGLTVEEAKNPEAARAAFQRKMDSFIPRLDSRGITPTPEHLYLAWQQGLAGFTQIHEAAQSGEEVSAARRRNMNANRPWIGSKKQPPNASPKEWLDGWVTYIRSNQRKF